MDTSLLQSFLLILLAAAAVGLLVGAIIGWRLGGARSARDAKMVVAALNSIHAEELADAERSGVQKFRATLWHGVTCQGPHDYPREPDRRKTQGPNVWYEYHCIRCGQQEWRQKIQADAGLGMKVSGG